MTATFFTIDGGAYLTTQSHAELRAALNGVTGGWVEMVPSGTLVNLAHVVAIEWGPGEESPNTIDGAGWVGGERPEVCERCQGRHVGECHAENCSIKAPHTGPCPMLLATNVTGQICPACHAQRGQAHADGCLSWWGVR